MRDQLQAHKRKLAEYKSDPMSHDNKGFLKDAFELGNSERFDRIFSSRINSLQRQIDNFQKQLDECEKRNGR